MVGGRAGAVRTCVCIATITAYISYSHLSGVGHVLSDCGSCSSDGEAVMDAVRVGPVTADC